MLDKAELAASLAIVNDRIAAAAAVSGRTARDVELLVAVKYLESKDLATLVAAGVTLVGENRVQELLKKQQQAPAGLRWHFIGQLQSRKVASIVGHVELIHSVASESVLDQLARHGNSETAVLLQVNLSGERSKAGIMPSELSSYIERCPVPVIGLMTMPPATECPEQNRRFFSDLRDLAAAHGLRELSMGTSQDYGVAIEEGATIIRLGSVLFGKATFLRGS